jgi:nitroreductase
LIVACALEEEAYGKMGGYMSSFPVDIGIAMEHLILAATEKGLGTCWIGAFNEKLVKDVLDIPDNVRVVALTPLGYPAEEGRLRGRKSLSEIVCYDRYTD